MAALLRPILLIAALVALLPGCSARESETRGPADPAGTEAALVVDNQSTSEMRIYAVTSGQRLRLGSVTGLSTERLTIPSYVVGAGRDIVFQADPLAGQSVANSFSVFVYPGDNVRMTIPPTIR